MSHSAPMPDLADPMYLVRHAALADEATLVRQLVDQAALDDAGRARIVGSGADLVRRIRGSAKPVAFLVWTSRS